MDLLQLTRKAGMRAGPGGRTAMDNGWRIEIKVDQARDGEIDAP